MESPSTLDPFLPPKQGDRGGLHCGGSQSATAVNFSLFVFHSSLHRPGMGDDRHEFLLLLHREAALHRRHVLIFNQRKFAPVDFQPCRLHVSDSLHYVFVLFTCQLGNFERRHCTSPLSPFSYRLQISEKKLERPTFLAKIFIFITILNIIHRKSFV